MTDLRKAAEMALGALERYAFTEGIAIQALRQALAQPDEVLAEREACAKVCLEEAQEAYHQESFYLPQGNPGLLRIAEGAKRCADAIRARGEK